MSFLDAREHGSKTGTGFRSGSQEIVDRRERLRRLALETIDLEKDPYFMKNHLGQYECRLCLTLHSTEGNYLSHTQGKRHQQNQAKRAAKEALSKSLVPPRLNNQVLKKMARIGRPGYRVTKQFDPDTKQRSLLFQISYPEIKEGQKPRHRFMSSYEQRKHPTDGRYQYILFHAEPYEVIAFKVPSHEVEPTLPISGDPSINIKETVTCSDVSVNKEKSFAYWDCDCSIYTLQIYFRAIRQKLMRLPPLKSKSPSSLNTMTPHLR